MTSLQNLHGMVGTHVTLSLGYMAFLLSSNSTTEKKDNPFFRKSTFGLVMSALVMFQFMFFVPLGFQKVTENITYGYIVSMLLMFLIEGTLVCVLTAVTVLTFIQCRKNHSLKLF